MQALRYAKKILEGKIDEFARMTGSLTIAPDRERYVKDFNAYVEIKSCKKSYL